MIQKDIEYLAKNISKLTEIPLRIFLNNDLVFYYSSTNLKIDPFLKEYKTLKIDDKGNNLYFCFNDFFYYYVFLKYENYNIVYGPTREIDISKNDLGKYIFSLNINQSDLIGFKEALLNIPHFSLYTLLSSLISLNFTLNNEKLNLKDILTRDNFLRDPEPIKENTSTHHISLGVENTLIDLVTRGDIEGFNNFLKNIPPISIGKTSKNELIQSRNMLIVITTLLSRAAIKAGVNIDEAFDLSDNFIQKAETTISLKEINDIQIDMIKTYIKLVEDYNLNGINDSLIKDAISYIHHNIQNKIEISDICEALYISKGVLCKRFKEATNKTINEFIVEAKVKKAIELMKDKTKTLIQISSFLDFSSQAYFNNVFKKVTGLNPKDYRNQKLK